MIRLTRLNRAPVLINADLIEHVDITPDTVICLINGHKLVVLESPEEVRDRVLEFRRAINQTGWTGASSRVVVTEQEESEIDGGE